LSFLTYKNYFFNLKMAGAACDFLVVRVALKKHQIPSSFRVVFDVLYCFYHSGELRVRI
jgi:hypothetical protein